MLPVGALSKRPKHFNDMFEGLLSLEGASPELKLAALKTDMDILRKEGSVKDEQIRMLLEIIFLESSDSTVSTHKKQLLQAISVSGSKHSDLKLRLDLLDLIGRMDICDIETSVEEVAAMDICETENSVAAMDICEPEPSSVFDLPSVPEATVGGDESDDSDDEEVSVTPWEHKGQTYLVDKSKGDIYNMRTEELIGEVLFFAAPVPLVRFFFGGVRRRLTKTCITNRTHRKSSSHHPYNLRSKCLPKIKAP
mgnify:CR=1 FL=1